MPYLESQVQYVKEYYYEFANKYPVHHQIVDDQLWSLNLHKHRGQLQCGAYRHSRLQ